ncbi:ROK family transcriptional regulator [Microbacterium sp. gxy059]|uniref:ROK family transcriptional regulator n=1 Tax=Microbacterium sp. gxy059 TaxID=2957199 RepID=UPI003D99A7AF
MPPASPPPWGDETGATLPVALEVLRHGPLSRADVGRALGLSHASLSRLSAALIERGILIDAGERSDKRVGRPTRLLDVDASAHRFIGIKLSESRLIAALTDLRGDVVDVRARALDSPSPDAVVRLIAMLTADLASDREITAIGVGLGGAVRERRLVSSASFLGWRDVPLARLVEHATQTATLVENDVIALCRYEDWFGSGRDDDRFAVVTLGVGTGFGLVVDGTPIVSEEHGIGLVGHWPMDPAGPLCDRGHRGCAAALLNAEAISRRLGDAAGSPVPFEEALDLAAAGDPPARAIIDEAARGLGVLLAAICNLTLPRRIVIAGEGARIAEIGEETMRRSLASLRAAEATTPPIVLAEEGGVEWARGAAALAIQAFVLGEIKAPVTT